MNALSPPASDATECTAFPGNYEKLGATLTTISGKPGTNFAVYTDPEVMHMWVCLFDKDGHETRYALNRHAVQETFLEDNKNECPGAVWHGFIPGIKEGQRYGFRADGPFNLAKARRLKSENPEAATSNLSLACAYHKNRLLIDPYAYRIEGNVDYLNPSYYNYDKDNASLGNTPDERYNGSIETHHLTIKDTAQYAPKCVVVDVDKVKKNYQCQEIKPQHDFQDCNICEVHVKEATALMEEVPECYRGTFKGLCHPAFIAQMKAAGKNVVELMPVQRGESHWKYNTEAFFDLEPSYAAKTDERGKPITQTPLEQFAEAVKTLRENGIDVWMDVVYNHTAEGDHRGPSFSFKGVDWRYYRHHHDGRFDAEYFWEKTGCGNLFNTDHPRVRQLMLDNMEFFHSLGVSGFRFDLAPALFRGGIRSEPNNNHKLIHALTQAIGPGGRLEGVHLTGEGWDMGGNIDLPSIIAPWDHAKDLTRAWLLPDGIKSNSLSSAVAAVGFSVAATKPHDGFTVIDSVSTKNGGKINQDGSKHRSIDCIGHGESHDTPRVMSERMARIGLGLFVEMLKQGPVLTKIGPWNSHGGDNNTYTHERAERADTNVPWSDRLSFYQRTIKEVEEMCGAYKRRHPAFHRKQEFTGKPNHDYAVLHKAGDKDVTWLHASGAEMQDWNGDHAFGMLLSGETGRVDRMGKAVRDIPMLVYINSSPNRVTMTLPPSELDTPWKMALSTSPVRRYGNDLKESPVLNANSSPMVSGKIELEPFSGVVFQSVLPKHVQLANYETAKLSLPDVSSRRR